jgi:FAD/FMN-containing dehydrogenase
LFSRFEVSVFRSWGGIVHKPMRVIAPADGAALVGNWLAYGNGRSYGDSCFPAPGGALVDMRSTAKVLGFASDTGRIRVEPGLTIGALIAHLHGSGWFPAVVPGTRHVTIGGAIANDIHGKNHHGAGTFGCHVLSLGLLRSDGEVMTCSAQDNAALFGATIGGMGLTGIITWAELQLMRTASADVVQEVLPLEKLGDFFAQSQQDDARFAYSVAWIDSLATGLALGRGALLRANHADSGAGARGREPRLSVRFTPPMSLINRPSLKVFNHLYRWRTLAKPGPARVGWAPFFFPLDAVENWNRLYGPRGLRQHQCVIPLQNAERTIRAMLVAAQAAGQGSFLTVLKLFGEHASPGLMSFPRAGATLTLDFPYRGAVTDRLLDVLDTMTLEAGGRVNIYKDARMSEAVFNASYPEAKEFRRFLDPKAASAFSQRVKLTG